MIVMIIILSRLNRGVSICRKEFVVLCCEKEVLPEVLPVSTQSVRDEKCRYTDRWETRAPEVLPPRRPAPSGSLTMQWEPREPPSPQNYLCKSADINDYVRSPSGGQAGLYLSTLAKRLE